MIVKKEARFIIIIIIMTDQAEISVDMLRDNFPLYFKILVLGFICGQMGKNSLKWGKISQFLLKCVCRFKDCKQFGHE